MVAWKYLTVIQLFYFSNNIIFKKENIFKKKFKLLLGVFLHDTKKHEKFDALC